MNGINVRPWGDEWLWSVWGENNTKHLGDGRTTTEAEAWMQVCKFLWDGAALAVRALRAERDAALADVAAWRGFAASVAVAVHPDGTGAVIADHLAIDDLPDLLAAVERVVAERDAAEADAEDVRVALLAALRGGE